MSELEHFDIESVLKNNPFHESFDNFLIKPDVKDMCFKLESFFPKLLEAIPPSLILPKPILSLAIRYIRDNATHPRLTGDSATLLKNYFMSVVKNSDKIKQPIISVDNNMFKTMLKICQIFAKFRNSETVEEGDYRMMEAFFQIMMYPSIDSQIAKKGKNIDRSDISNLSIPKQT